MSRAYRIRVSESVTKVLRAHDSVSTQLEVLEILPREQMAGLLAEELQRRGFTDEKGQQVRRDGAVKISIDPQTATVTVSVEGCKEVELTREADATVWERP